MSSSDGGADPQSEISEKEATYEEFSELLTLPKEMLLQIVNHLDPKSFVKLASTCKYLLNFCQNSKGIRVVYKMPSMQVIIEGDGDCIYDHHPHVDFEKLRKWPFNIYFKQVTLHNLDLDFTWARVNEEIKPHFLTIGVKKIHRVFPRAPELETVRDMEYLTEFVKIFDIDQIHLMLVVPEETFDACLKLSVPELWISRIHNPHFDMEQVEKIMKMWKTRNGLKNWRFYYDPDSFNMMNYFDDWETLSFASAGPIVSKRRLVFTDVRTDGYIEKKSFYLLRDDEKVLRIVIYPYIMEFNICPAGEAPSALRSPLF